MLVSTTEPGWFLLFHNCRLEVIPAEFYAERVTFCGVSLAEFMLVYVVRAAYVLIIVESKGLMTREDKLDEHHVISRH